MTARAGSTENVSVSMPSDLLGALRARAGRRGVSTYIADAVRHQLEMDGLGEIVAAHESEHGPLSEQEIQAATQEMFGNESSTGAAGRDAA